MKDKKWWKKVVRGGYKNKMVMNISYIQMLLMRKKDIKTKKWKFLQDNIESWKLWKYNKDSHYTFFFIITVFTIDFV